MTEKTVTVVDQSKLLDSIKEYYTTPEELRDGVRTLRDLGTHLGVKESDIVRSLNASPDSAGMILNAVALQGALKVPRVLQKLMEAVEAGSVKAAEIYLDFIRKTIQDENLIRAAKHRSQDLAMVLDSVENQVSGLLQIAQQTTSAKDLKAVVDYSPRGLQARMELAIEADDSIPKAEILEEPVDAESP
jgi:hypothetical protein